MNIINLTPHDIVVENENGKQVFKTLGKDFVPRIVMDSEELNDVEDFPVRKLKVSHIKNLPSKRSDTIIIVSSMIGQEICSKRDDVYCPDTDRAKRNEKGHIVSVPGFVRYE